MKGEPMEKQQAIDLLDNLIGMVEDNQENDYDAAFRMGIEALKAQLSCEDATSDLISRQAAIDVIEDYPHGNVWNVESMEEMVDKIKTLPTVQPEPHEGEWIPVHPLQGDDPGAYMCSKCKTGMWEIRPSAYHYCPNCGAKMKGERQK